MKNKVKQAVITLTGAIDSDPELRRAYKDNIAMAIRDAATRFIQDSGRELVSYNDIYLIANEGAEAFLNIWCCKE
jgi:hypothetical protein